MNISAASPPIDKFAGAFGLRYVTAERIVILSLGLFEPPTETGVCGRSALATVLVFTTVHGSFDFVDHVQERAEVAGGEVVAHALENVQDLVVRDVAIAI